jgi:hypothetical protein
VVTGELPKLKTSVKTAWNHDSFFIKFDCEDTGTPVSDYKNFNDPIYDEDVVEIFIKEQIDFDCYKEFNISPANVRLHYLVLNGKKYARISDVVKSNVSKHLKGFSVEIEIPNSEFLIIPQKDILWKINFYRIDRSEYDEYSAYSPTGEIRFHKPECFSLIKFM